MGSFGGAGQGGASCLHLATPKAPGVSGCCTPLGLGAGDAGRAAGAGKFSVCRAKAKRREKGPETLLVKEGGCRPGRDSGTAPGRDAPSGHCPAPSRPPALLGHAQATHRPVSVSRRLLCSRRERGMRQPRSARTGPFRRGGRMEGE